MQVKRVYAGVDVSKATLAVHFEGEDRSFDNTGEGCEKLLDWVGSLHAEAAVACEATGGYEQRLVEASEDRAMVCAVLQPPVAVITPGPSVNWPRPIRSMRSSLPAWPTPFNRRAAGYSMEPGVNWPLWCASASSCAANSSPSRTCWLNSPMRFASTACWQPMSQSWLASTNKSMRSWPAQARCKPKRYASAKSRASPTSPPPPCLPICPSSARCPTAR